MYGLRKGAGCKDRRGQGVSGSGPPSLQVVHRMRNEQSNRRLGSNPSQVGAKAFVVEAYFQLLEYLPSFW